jgi:hypothetical protein
MHRHLEGHASLQTIGANFGYAFTRSSRSGHGTTDLVVSEGVLCVLDLHGSGKRKGPGPYGIGDPQAIDRALSFDLVHYGLDGQMRKQILHSVNSPLLPKLLW